MVKLLSSASSPVSSLGAASSEPAEPSTPTGPAALSHNTFVPPGKTLAHAKATSAAVMLNTLEALSSGMKSLMDNAQFWDKGKLFER